MLKATVSTILILFFALVFKIFLRQDIDGMLEWIMFFGGVYSFRMLGAWLPLRLPRDFNVVFWTILFPSALFQSFVVGTVKGEPGLLPFVGSDWKVVLESVHYTGQMGLFLFLANLLGVSNERKPITFKKIRFFNLISAFLGVYFVVFSGSRSSILALVVVIGLLPLTSKMHRCSPLFLTLVAVFVTVSPFLFVHKLDGVILPGFLGELLKLTPRQHKYYGVMSGRSWLWRYHWNLFKNNFWTGVEASLVDFKTKEVIMGQIAKAGSESFFTRVLARDGIWAVFFLGFFVWLAWKPVKVRNRDAYLWGIAILTMTVGLPTFGYTYSFLAIAGYWMYFSLLSEVSLDERRGGNAPDLRHRRHLAHQEAPSRQVLEVGASRP